MQHPVEPKKKFQMPVVPTINISKWFLLVLPLSVGGFWLVLHPEIITSNLDKPYMLLAGPALIASILVGWLLVKFFQSIVAACRKLWEAFQDWRTKPGSMFWIIINIFLLVSVSESGNYFNGLLGSNDMYGVLGYSVAFVIDLVAIQCMQARLSASRMRDTTGERLYQLGVIACAGLSAWANTYTALEHFQAPTNATHLPAIMIAAAPWTGMAFPLLIIFLSFTADYTADQTTSKLDPEAYKIAEENRNKLLRYQRDSLKERKELEQDIDLYNGKIAVVKIERDIFYKRWFMPARYPEIQKIVEQVSALYEPQIKALNEQIEALNVAKSEQIVNTSANTKMSSQVFTPANSTVFATDDILANTPDDISANNERTQKFAEMFTPANNLVNTSHDTLLFTPDDNAVNASANSTVFATDDILANSQVFTPANFEMTPQRTKSRRTTVKLSEHQRDTDELGTVNTSVNTSANKKAYRESVTSINSGDAAKRIERILKRTPDISVSDLAKKAEVSRGYASEKRSEFLKSKVSA